MPYLFLYAVPYCGHFDQNKIQNRQIVILTICNFAENNCAVPPFSLVLYGIFVA